MQSTPFKGPWWLVPCLRRDGLLPQGGGLLHGEEGTFPAGLLVRSSYLWLIDPSCVVPTLALQDPSFVSSRPAELGGSQQDGWEEAAPAQAPFPSVAPAQASCPHPHLISSFPHSPLLSFSSPPPPPHPPHPPPGLLGFLRLSCPCGFQALSPFFSLPSSQTILSVTLLPRMARTSPARAVSPAPPPSVLAPGYSPPRGEGSRFLMSSLLWGQTCNPP